MKRIRTVGFWPFLLWGILGMLLAFALPALQIRAQSAPPITTMTLSDRNQAQQLNLQGQALLNQGNPQAALERWLEAEAAYRQMGNEQGIIGTQLNQARALQALGFYRRARTRVEQVVALQQLQPNSSLKANGLLTLGNLLRILGEYEGSQQVLMASLTIAQQINSPADAQGAYFHLGTLLLAQGQGQAALSQFQKAAALTGPLQLTAHLRQVKVLQKLGRFREAQPLLIQLQSQLAQLPPSQQSIYGRIELAELLLQAEEPSQKRALQTAQWLAMAVDQARKLGDLRSESYATGRLGHLYERTQQWREAQQLTEQALQLARQANVPEIIYQWQWQRGRILRVQGNLPEATRAYREAVAILQSLRGDLTAIGQEAQFSFRDQVEPVYRELVDLLLQPTATQTDVQAARQVIESLQVAELNNFFREACLDAEVRTIDEIDPAAAVIYPVILRDRLEVILSLPHQPLKHYATHLSQTEIESGIQQMQASFRPTSFPQERLRTAQQLYRWLIQPIAEDLSRSPVQTLAFVLDGSLRNLPMAALHDGKHYLIEQYQIALAPGLQLLNPRSLQQAQIRALVGGLTEGVRGSSPLPGVKQEVDQIRRQVPAQVLLNESFTTTALQNQVQTTPFSVIHLATHGQFSSNARDTYIQTWDGRLTVNQLQTLLNQQSLAHPNGIELLVLSACQTAQGDKHAALGMAGVAVRSGARSTLATLWQVDDESTPAFITQFYKTLTQSGGSKAKAVREAQLTLIRSLEFNHPFYWAPFILVGNWL